MIAHPNSSKASPEGLYVWISIAYNLFLWFHCHSVSTWRTFCKVLFCSNTGEYWRRCSPGSELRTRSWWLWAGQGHTTVDGSVMLRQPLQDPGAPSPGCWWSCCQWLTAESLLGKGSHSRWCQLPTDSPHSDQMQEENTPVPESLLGLPQRSYLSPTVITVLAEVFM